MKNVADDPHVWLQVPENEPVKELSAKSEMREDEKLLNWAAFVQQPIFHDQAFSITDKLVLSIR